MPRYTFKCSDCEHTEDKNLSISNYLELIKEKIKCVHCDSGVLFQELKPVHGNVEKRKEDLMMESKAEVRKIVEKIKSGDSKAIKDIYGENPNPYKTGA